MNRKNLKLLADYLMTLPEDYQHFEMRWYHGIHMDSPPVKVELSISDCGTAGCAIGHAPYVEGLPQAEYEEEWDEYSERLFCIDADDDEWMWCFSSFWAKTDNTPHGAAKRIYWLLEHGLPDDWEYQLTGDAELCYNEMKGE